MKLIDSCKGADGVWRMRVEVPRWSTLAELEALLVAARAEVAKREAEPDAGPCLPCCGYPRAECECERCWRCGEVHRNEPKVIDCEKRHERNGVSP